MFIKKPGPPSPGALCGPPNIMLESEQTRDGIDRRGNAGKSKRLEARGAQERAARPPPPALQPYGLPGSAHTASEHPALGCCTPLVEESAPRHSRRRFERGCPLSSRLCRERVGHSHALLPVRTVSAVPREERRARPVASASSSSILKCGTHLCLSRYIVSHTPACAGARAPPPADTAQAALRRSHLSALNIHSLLTY